MKNKIKIIKKKNQKFNIIIINLSSFFKTCSYEKHVFIDNKKENIKFKVENYQKGKKKIQKLTSLNSYKF